MCYNKTMKEEKTLDNLKQEHKNAFDKFLAAYNKTVKELGYQPDYAMQWAYTHKDGVFWDCYLKSEAGQRKWYEKKIEYLKSLGFTA